MSSIGIHGQDPNAAGGGTEVTEDDAAVADPSGVHLIARRRDTLVSEVDTDADVVAVNATAKGEVYTKHVDPITAGQISTLNSTSVPLVGTGTFTGTAEDVSRYGSVTVEIQSASATANSSATLFVEFSPDATNWDVSISNKIDVGTTNNFIYPVIAQYVRVRLVNGSFAQTALRLQTAFKATSASVSPRGYGPVTFSAVNDRLDVPLGPNSGAGFVYDPGTFTGTISCAWSYDGGVNFSQWCPFINPQTGGIYNQAGYSGSADTTTVLFQILLPAGATHARVFCSAFTGGTADITVVTGNVPAFSPLSFCVQNDFVTPEPLSGLQIGGSVGANNEFHAVHVNNDHPALSAYGLTVREVGHSGVNGSTSAGSLQMFYTGGRDPVNNLLRGFDIKDAAISATGWNGVICRPYPTHDGTRAVPMADDFLRARWVRDGKQRLPADTFSLVHEPGANAQATITKAAAGAGIRNVCTAIMATLVSDGTAVTPVQVYVRLRDGATGAGTVLWTGALSLSATGGVNAPPIMLSDLWIEGSQDTAMTFEFSAAAGANTIETVSMSGVVSTE